MQLARTHRPANAVVQEPSRRVLNLKNAVQLVRADAFLGRGDEVEGLQPLVHGQMAVPKNRALTDSELATAFGLATLPQTVADAPRLASLSLFPVRLIVDAFQLRGVIRSPAVGDTLGLAAKRCSPHT